MFSALLSIVFAAGLTFGAGTAIAFAADVTSVPGLEAAEESRRIQARFLAPCCWSENLATHNSPVAVQLREEIAGMVASGQTESQIVDEYVARYGERILREPRGTQFWILMITPIAALGIGCLLLVRFLLRLRRQLLPPQPVEEHGA